MVARPSPTSSCDRFKFYNLLFTVSLLLLRILQILPLLGLWFKYNVAFWKLELWELAAQKWQFSMLAF